MKSIWTPGQVRWTHEGRLHPFLLWSLWTVTIVLLCLWLAGLAVGIHMGGWIHALAIGAVVLGAICTRLVFRNDWFLERPLKKRQAPPF